MDHTIGYGAIAQYQPFPSVILVVKLVKIALSPSGWISSCSADGLKWSAISLRNLGSILHWFVVVDLSNIAC